MAENVLRFDFLARDRASATMEHIGKESDGLASKVGKFGKVAALAIGGAAVGGVLALGKAFKDGVAAADYYTNVSLKTAAVIKSTGNQAGISVKGVQTLAASLESLGTTDEELIINSQNVLATFTSIRNVGKNRIFDEATKSALDMSVALGTNLQGASIQVGKALNDPIKGVSALSKVGVSFTQGQKDQIKAMVASGHTMDAQKLILKELNKEFGGAAKAAGSGFGGAVFRAKDAIGDLQRDISMKALPALTSIADWVTNTGVPKLKEFTDWMGKTGIPRFVSGMTKARDAAEKVWDKFDFSGVADKIQDQAKDWGGLIMLGVSVGLQTGDWAELGRILGGGLQKALGGLGAASGGIVKAVAGVFGDIDWEVLGESVGKTAFPFIVGFSATLFDGLFKVAKEHPLNTALLIASIIPVGKLFSAFGPARALLEHLPFGTWIAKAFDHSAAPAFDAIWNFIKFLGRGIAIGFREIFPAAERSLGKIITDLVDTFKIKGLYAADGARDFVWSLAKGIGRGIGRVVLSIANVVLRMTRPFRNADTWLIGAGRDVLAGLIHGVIDRISTVGRAAIRVGTAITRPFAKAGSWLFQSGRQLLAGLRNGMFDGVQAAGSWAASVGGKIVRAVKNFFGIHSPSKVFGGIGTNLIQSLFGKMVDHNPVQAITKIFGGMPQALGALVDKSLVSIDNLPGKAMNALSGLGGKFSNIFGGGNGGGAVRLGGVSDAERWIIMHESGGRTNARNPTSTAFGLGQLLIANRQHYGKILGVSANTTDYGSQLKMFRMYVRDRYGNAENAERFWKAHHWYDAGGMATGVGYMAKNTLRPERVLSPGQTVAFDRLTRVLDRRSSAVGSAGAGTDIDYAKLGDHVARAFTRAGVQIKMDGKAVGKIIGKDADLLSRAG